MTSVLFFLVATAAFTGHILRQFSCSYSGDCNIKQSTCNKYNSHELAFRMIAAAFVCVAYIGKKKGLAGATVMEKNWALV